ncbi:Putative Zinc finger C2H2-type [Septoria linicola]|uniref:Zinc finger C2H2-type n=1 Tax=Septoria linicola TaxID=215465 RepID=A0A9Q9EF73_9PEZI|nr:Putative Zinc finger C2H2-type [Septoria linicola]
MTTFADYPAHTMASNDFTLYPDPESWIQEQSYLPTSTYPDQTYLSTTSFDSFSVQPSFSSQAYSQLGFEQPAEAAKDRYRSPAQSTAHSFDYHNPPQFSATSDSGHSTISSAMGSPSAHPQHSEWSSNLNLFPDIVQQHDSNIFATTGFDYVTIPVTDKGCVDPALIQPYSPPHAGIQFPDTMSAQSPQPMTFSSASPVPSRMSLHGERSGSVKPSPPYQTWQQHPEQSNGRRPSISSVHSRHSQNSHSSDDSNKGLCPIATCGRHVKDLKAHMLTHQQERPEKCPIPTCEYHTKGFARKYDKNRHTLTHYKGTMVCGFCPGSGSAAEKSFNRADVFKRHLCSVHQVEQTPPNARRKSPTTAPKKTSSSAREVSGMCSTCGNTFVNAQDFYEHLDDCVLRVVQQAEPSEATNEKLLTEISQDKECQDTLEKHHLPVEVDLTASTNYDQEDEVEEDGDEDDAMDGTYGKRAGKNGKRVGKNGAIVKPSQRKGLTLSKNGVPLAGAMTGKGSKRRKNYPLSWGAAPDKMKMKKRVLCVYDGQRRLWKDDLMMDGDHEVRMPFDSEDPRGPYVTDLDVLTLRRAEGVLNATEEEKGPWQDEEELQRLMES